MNQRQRRKYQTLQRRLRWLTDRDLGAYDRAEASALRFALNVIDEAERQGLLSQPDRERVGIE